MVWRGVVVKDMGKLEEIMSSIRFRSDYRKHKFKTVAYTIWTLISLSHESIKMGLRLVWWLYST